ncbi:MAG: class I SAM-dependent methyltransferase [Treponemataceae bacterium]|nr:class I SAM-dependent methyltransferase [Treponemataceae bacterium]
MSKLAEYIGSQFGNPRGIVGFVCCKCMNIINRKMYRKTVSLLTLDKNRKLLDIGYGNGYLLELADKSFGCNLYGIDISEDMKNLAEKRNKKALQENRLKLEVGDCCNLRFEDNTFDAVSSINTVYFWSSTVKGLSEIRRCLVPGGCFVNAVYTKEWLSRTKMADKGFKKFEPDELVELGKQAGFENIEVTEIVKEKSFAVVYRK